MNTLPEWAKDLPDAALPSSNNYTHVVVDVDERKAILKGSEKECADWAYNHNGKVIGNGGMLCYVFLPLTKEPLQDHEIPDSEELNNNKNLSDWGRSTKGIQPNQPLMLAFRKDCEEDLPEPIGLFADAGLAQEFIKQQATDESLSTSFEGSRVEKHTNGDYSIVSKAGNEWILYYLQDFNGDKVHL